MSATRSLASIALFYALQRSSGARRTLQTGDSGPLLAPIRTLAGQPDFHQAEWGPESALAPLREWRSAVEAVGVLVMQDGPVPVEEMRGFASLAPRQVPAILVNNQDDPRARVFTLVHELGHAA